MTDQFVTIDQHEKLEETVQEIASTVSDLSKAQAATNASIESLAGLIKSETQNRQSDSVKTESALKEIANELKVRPQGISSGDMLKAVVVSIGAIGTVVAIIAAIGTLGVWIATIISTNVADDLDAKNYEAINNLSQETTIVHEHMKFMEQQHLYLLDKIEKQDERNDRQDVLLQGARP